MASLINQDGRRILQFAHEGKRRAIYLGKMTTGAADAVKGHVENILIVRQIAQPMPVGTAAWLNGIGNKLHRKLARLGVIDARKSPESVGLKAMIDTYISRRTDVKPRTRTNLEQSRNALVSFFGEGRDYATITRGEAGDWHRSMREKLSEATITTHVKKARQFFSDAIDRQLISGNPFLSIKAGSMVNEDRCAYVPAEDVLRVIDACPDAEWRMIFALARFGGLRCPSEIVLLKWTDVNFETGRIVVHSPKTEHNQGGATRIIPLFPELRRWLMEGLEAADDGAVHVVLRHRHVTNWRTRAERIIGRAAVQLWPRLFQNLRASCETDLATRVPLHVACKWIGNSQIIARKHYLQVTDDHFAAAIGNLAQAAAPSVCRDRGLRAGQVEAGNAGGGV